MKVIIFSDVHGNKIALENMLKEECPKKEDVCIFCGDLLGYYYSEESVLHLLQGIPKLYAVKGNHDYYYATMTTSGKNDILKQKYGSSYNTCKGDVCNYINSLPNYLTFTIESKKFFLCHGSMDNHLEGRIYPDTRLEEVNYDYVLHGHSHYQMKRIIGSTVYINPGSLGQPRDGKGFSYCVMNMQQSGIENIKFKTVDITISTLQEECLQNEGIVTYANTVLNREKRDC